MRTSIIQQAKLLGKEIWERELRLFKIQAQEIPSNEDICRYFGASSMDDFFSRLGQGEMPLSDLERFIETKTSATRSKNPYSLKLFLFPKDKKDDKDQCLFSLGMVLILLIHFASAALLFQVNLLLEFLFLKEEMMFTYKIVKLLKVFHLNNF
jgi:GTP pyrophosphokinase